MQKKKKRVHREKWKLRKRCNFEKYKNLPVPADSILVDKSMSVWPAIEMAKTVDSWMAAAVDSVDDSELPRDNSSYEHSATFPPDNQKVVGHRCTYCTCPDWWRCLVECCLPDIPLKQKIIRHQSKNPIPTVNQVSNPISCCHFHLSASGTYGG